MQNKKRNIALFIVIILAFSSIYFLFGFNPSQDEYKELSIEDVLDYTSNRNTIEDLSVTSELKSDHILNLLPELDGKFPEAKQICLDTLDRYLALPEKERLNFRLGRRAGLYEKLDDIYDAMKFQKVEQVINRITSETSSSIDDAIRQLMESFV